MVCGLISKYCDALGEDSAISDRAATAFATTYNTREMKIFMTRLRKHVHISTIGPLVCLSEKHNIVCISQVMLLNHDRKIFSSVRARFKNKMVTESLILMGL